MHTHTGIACTDTYKWNTFYMVEVWGQFAGVSSPLPLCGEGIELGGNTFTHRTILLPQSFFKKIYYYYYYYLIQLVSGEVCGNQFLFCHVGSKDQTVTHLAWWFPTSLRREVWFEGQKTESEGHPMRNRRQSRKGFQWAPWSAPGSFLRVPVILDQIARGGHKTPMIHRASKYNHLLTSQSILLTGLWRVRHPVTTPLVKHLLFNLEGAGIGLNSGL